MCLHSPRYFSHGPAIEMWSVVHLPLACKDTSHDVSMKQARPVIAACRSYIKHIDGANARVKQSRDPWLQAHLDEHESVLQQQSDRSAHSSDTCTGL